MSDFSEELFFFFFFFSFLLNPLSLHLHNHFFEGRVGINLGERAGKGRVDKEGEGGYVLFCSVERAKIGP